MRDVDQIVQPEQCEAGTYPLQDDLGQDQEMKPQLDQHSDVHVPESLRLEGIEAGSVHDPPDSPGHVSVEALPAEVDLPRQHENGEETWLQAAAEYRNEECKRQEPQDAGQEPVQADEQEPEYGQQDSATEQEQVEEQAEEPDAARKQLPDAFVHHEDLQKDRGLQGMADKGDPEGIIIIDDAAKNGSHISEDAGRSLLSDCTQEQAVLEKGWQETKEEQEDHEAKDRETRLPDAVKSDALRAGVAGLPPWICIGQKLQWWSESQKRLLPVRVSKIEVAKRVVIATFEENPDIWKSVPFSSILGKSACPLRPYRERVTEAGHQLSTPDRGKVASQGQPKLVERSRSRSRSATPEWWQMEGQLDPQTSMNQYFERQEEKRRTAADREMRERERQQEEKRRQEILEAERKKVQDAFEQRKREAEEQQLREEEEWRQALRRQREEEAAQEAVLDKEREEEREERRKKKRKEKEKKEELDRKRRAEIEAKEMKRQVAEEAFEEACRIAEEKRQAKDREQKAIKRAAELEEERRRRAGQAGGAWLAWSEHHSRLPQNGAPMHPVGGLPIGSGSWPRPTSTWHTPEGAMQSWRRDEAHAAGAYPRPMTAPIGAPGGLRPTAAAHLLPAPPPPPGRLLRPSEPASRGISTRPKTSGPVANKWDLRSGTWAHGAAMMQPRGEGRAKADAGEWPEYGEL